ncbi:hypothetical protein PG996_008620 [Apiospora saccharicola]|uniref:Uncharacterized protein n=1 Tax=Apiospora saccharicola TaxID=335842 RepID=A0ABR1UYG0_9PEZI
MISEHRLRWRTWRPPRDGHFGGPRSVLHHPVATASFVEILSTKLRSLWCVESLEWNSRVYYPSPPPEPEPGRLADVLEACPLRPCFGNLAQSSVSFDWLERDPRPAVGPDLPKLTFRKDPRRFLHSWRNLEESLGVRRPADSAFRFYVAVANAMLGEITSPEQWILYGHPTTNLRVRQQVHRRLWQESYDRQARSAFDRLDPRPAPEHGRFPEDGQGFKEREGQGAATALGMWMFPGDAFGSIDDCDVGGVYSVPNHDTSTPFSVPGLPGLVVFDI